VKIANNRELISTANLIIGHWKMTPFNSVCEGIVAYAAFLRNSLYSEGCKNNDFVLVDLKVVSGL